MASRGHRGGPNRSKGMATRAASEFCKAEVATCGGGFVMCRRRLNHSGLHRWGEIAWKYRRAETGKEPGREQR